MALRILHISSLWPPSVLGGAELYAARLAEQQRVAGHTVGVVTLGVTGDDVVATVPAWPYRLDQFDAAGPWRRAAFHARDVYDPVAHHTVRRAIERFRPDVVHTHAVAGLSVAALTAATSRGVAHVHTLHDHWLLCQRTTMVQADGTWCTERCRGCRVVSEVRERALHRHGPDLVIAPSVSILQTHQRYWPWLAQRGVVLAHPADLADRRGRRAAAAPVTFGYLGGLTAAKGLLTLLAAFRVLPRGAAELVVVGSGPLEGDVLAAARHGLPVRAVGFVGSEQRDELLASLDCLVVPSEVPETAGLVVAESRAAGLPAIASRAGALPEYVDPANRALLFAPGDVDGLAASMRAFIDDPARFAPTGPPPATWSEHEQQISELYDRARSGMP